MPCYRPKDASVVLSPTKRRSMPFVPASVNCSRCIGCKRENARQWVIRMRHELQMHDDATAVTLTYSNENLPEGNSLRHSDVRDFLKRFRHLVGPFRYFMCGEYGESNQRPHYHAILFGVDLPDRYDWMHTGRSVQYRSPTLESAWKHGFSTVGDVSAHTVQYVAGYLTKKLYGEAKDAEYRSEVDNQTGEILRDQRDPPYHQMSRRPGLGRSWIEAHHDEVYPTDFIVLDRRRMRPPSYYDRWLLENDPEMHAQVMHARYTEAAKAHDKDMFKSSLRLSQMEQAVEAKLLPFNERPFNDDACIRGV